MLVLFLACALRFLWAGDMEWKADELLMHQMAKQASDSGSLPWIGMKSGIGLANAGFSIWPFVLFYKISSDPVNMVRMVMLCNVLALLLFWYCAGKLDEDKRVMQFGILLAGVNILMVLFSRKLWAQDLMPLFVASMWFLQLRRKGMVFLFLWGLVSALSGQLHMSGFFFAFGLFFGTCLTRGINIKQAGIFILGFLVGLLPALPWLQTLFAGSAGSDANAVNILKFEFFLHAVVDPLGINAQYSLGSDLMQFAKFPRIGSIPLFLPVLAVLAVVVFFVSGIVARIREKFQFPGMAKLLQRPLVFYLFSMVLVPGILLTLSGSPIRSHYLIAAAPFLHAGFAWIWLGAGKKAIWVVVFSQLAITLLFLFFVHNSTHIHGDYGTPFRHQKTEIIP